MRNKLRSNQGSSMFIALIFVIVAVFVGGSVLAAATANIGRLRSRRVEEQTFLNQRSIVALMADKLTPSSGDLKLLFAPEGTDKVTVTAGDPTRDPSNARDGVLELFYEVAAYSYLAANYSGRTVTWVNFQTGENGQPKYSGAAAYNSKGEFKVKNSWDSAEITASYTCDNTAEAGRYSMYVEFADNYLRLKLRAVTTTTAGGTKLSWKSPSIVKGGTDN